MRFFMAGLLTMGYAVTALFFLRYWKRSGERLFVFFAIAFALLAVQRLGLAFLTIIDADWLYALRLLAFLLLLAGILEKNRSAT